jgi:hypothetical protein
MVDISASLERVCYLGVVGRVAATVVDQRHSPT